MRTGSALVAAAVERRIRVEDLVVRSGVRDADAVTRANHRGCVQNHDKQIFRPFPAANEREDAIVGVIAVQPFKTAPVEIHFVQSRFRGEQFVEVGD